MISSPLAASTIRLARVTYVHPEGQKMEVIFLDTGDYGRDVQVMTPYGGTDFGFTGGIPSPEEEGHDVNLEDNDAGKRHILAVVATLQGIHVCLGYLYPQITQMAFTKDGDKNRLIERHTSDFVRTIDDKGNMDLAHPSGAFITISEQGEPADLGGRDFDKVFALKHNTKSFPQVALRSIMPAGASKTISAEVRLSGAGACSIHAREDVSVDAQTRDMTLTAGRDLVATVTETIEVSAGEDVTFIAGSDFSVRAEDIRIFAEDSAQVMGANVLLRADGQVTCNAPITCVKERLIIGGGLSFGACPAVEISAAMEARTAGEAGISGSDQDLTLSAANIIIEGLATIIVRAPIITFEADDIVLDGRVQVNGDIFVDGFLYDKNAVPGD